MHTMQKIDHFKMLLSFYGFSHTYSIDTYARTFNASIELCMAEMTLSSIIISKDCNISWFDKDYRS